MCLPPLPHSPGSGSISRSCVASIGRSAIHRPIRGQPSFCAMRSGVLRSSAPLCPVHRATTGLRLASINRIAKMAAAASKCFSVCPLMTFDVSAKIWRSKTPQALRTHRTRGHRADRRGACTCRDTSPARRDAHERRELNPEVKPQVIREVPPERARDTESNSRREKRPFESFAHMLGRQGNEECHEPHGHRQAIQIRLSLLGCQW